jgi:hypothetical protein
MPPTSSNSATLEPHTTLSKCPLAHTFLFGEPALVLFLSTGIFLVLYSTGVAQPPVL